MRLLFCALATGLVLGSLIGMTLAARGYEPYASLRALLSVDIWPGERSRPATSDSGSDGARDEADPQDEAVRLAERLRARSPGGGALRLDSRLRSLALRRRLIRYVWNEPALDFSRKPDSYSRNIATRLKRPLAGVRRTDRIVVRQSYGIDSRIEIHMPTETPRGFVIVHGGHADVEALLRPMMESLTRSDYAIAVMNMPMMGWNPRPVVRLASFGTMALTSHALLPLLAMRPSRSLALFLDPVVVTVNVARRLGFKTIGMVGISGGGWTTTLSAAVDPRITRSYDIAGSLPMYLRSVPGNEGDVEQLVPDFYAIAGYEELYVLSALEPGRRHSQVVNDRDPCCFALRRKPGYVQAVRDALRRSSGGSFDFAISRNAEHSMTDETRASVL